MGSPPAHLPEIYLSRISRHTGLPRRVLVMTALALLLIVLLAGAVFTTAQRYRNDQRWTLHSYQVRETVLQVLNHFHIAEMEARSYGLTGRETALRRYWRAIDATESETGKLAALVEDNPRQTDAVRQLSDAIATRRKVFEQILTDHKNQGASAAHADVIKLISTPDRPVLAASEPILTRETRLLDIRTAASIHNGHTVDIVAIIALAGSILLLLMAFATTGIEQHRRIRSERAFEQSTVDLQLALADAKHASDTLQRLSVLAELLQSCRNLEEATHVIERALPPLLPEVSGALALLNASRNTVETQMHWGARGSELGDAIFVPDDCWALRRNQPHPGIDDHVAPICPHLAQTSVTTEHSLCLPLNSHGQVLGVLTLCAHAPLAPEVQRLAATASDQLALALGNLQLQASLRTQSIRDPLTSLFNRRYLEASLPRELLRAERRHGGLSVLMFDLDHFKRYNDTQGHDAGDALLSGFGVLLAQSCRGEDIPCRFGGEEFTLVLTDANHAHALQRAESIRKATSELVVHYRAGTLPPATVSIGVASYPEHGDTPDRLLHLADQALYRAKHLGRNKVASANDLQPLTPTVSSTQGT